MYRRLLSGAALLAIGLTGGAADAQRRGYDSDDRRDNDRSRGQDARYRSGDSEVLQYPIEEASPRPTRWRTRRTGCAWW